MRSIAVVFAAALSGAALADNPLVIQGILTDSDAIAIGYDGPNSPGPSTFYYDLYTFHVDTTAVYTVAMTSEAATLRPWIGVYGMNFNALDYLNPWPIDLVAGPQLTTVSMDLMLTAGDYQAVASSVDWIEDPNALDEGAYTVRISGPEGTNITLVPGPGVLALVGLGLLTARRRR